jgi:hypothetical protein
MAICYEALMQAGFITASAFTGAHSAETGGEDPSLAGLGVISLMTLGFVFGLKHASEADHVVAVSTIVSEHRSVARAALVGGLWGAGHTLSLVVVGVLVLALRIAIPESVASWLEFGVALMIIALGGAAVARALRRRSDVHTHTHAHGHVGSHEHVHFHDGESAHAAEATHHSHAVRRIGLKPVVVGAVHGLAGSAALTLLVLAQIESPAVGFAYLLVFGLGSIGGMLAMSGLVGLPFALVPRRLDKAHVALQLCAGAFSVLFGIWYAGQSTGMF